MKLLLILTFSASSLICFSQINLLKKASEKAGGFINKEVKLSENDIADGLTEALVRGSSYSVDLASAEGGFNNNELIRIPFPDEAIKIKTSLSKIGLNGKVEEFENSMNKAAETASKKALSILLDAIKKMSINDALTILNGEDNAATIYLKNNTQEFLYSEFKHAQFEGNLKDYQVFIIDTIGILNYTLMPTMFFILTNASSINSLFSGCIFRKCIFLCFWIF